MTRDLKDVALLSKNPEIDGFLDEFQKESDRAAAVLGAAMLDELLCRLLAARFVTEHLADQLLSGTRPLGTFSARITLAEAVGLISPEEARDLHTIRGIRNDFAHRLNGMSFDMPSVRDRCANLQGAHRTLELPGNSRFAEVYPRTWRSIFNLAVSVAMVHINYRMEQVQRIVPAQYLIA